MGKGTTRTRVFCAATLLLGACAAPFAELQSARLAGRGRVELTAAYSNVDGADEGETLKIQDVFGLHAATGISDRVDIRARLEHIRVSDEATSVDASATTLGIGPKFSLQQDRLAVFLPVGFAFQGKVRSADTWQFHPTVLYTHPIGQTLDANAALKALVSLSDHREPDGSRADVLFAFNLGLGINLAQDRWTLRPEFGLMKNPNRGGAVRHFSLGLSRFLSVAQK